MSLNIFAAWPIAIVGVSDRRVSDFGSKKALTNRSTKMTVFGCADAHVLRAIDGLITNRFLRLWLNAFDFTDSVTGTTRLKLTQAAMARIPVSVPPVNEQSRFVTRVEELLKRLDTARDHLSKVPVILKRFRHAVLAAACSGRLTEDWREGQGTTEDAQVLLSRILLGRKAQWESAQITKSSRRGTNPPCHAEGAVNVY